MIKTLYSYFKEIKEISLARFILLFILTLFSSLVEGFAILNLKTFINLNLLERSPYIILFSYFLIVLLLASLSYFKTFLQASLQSVYLANKRETIFENYLALSANSFINSSLGEIINNLSQKLEDAATSIFIFLQITSSICFLLIFIIFSFSSSPLLTSLCITIGLSSFLIFKVFFKKGYTLGSKLMRETSSYYNKISSYLKNLLRFKIAGTEQLISNIHKKQSENLSSLLLVTAKEKAKLTFLTSMLFALAVLLIASFILYTNTSLNTEFLTSLLFIIRIFSKISSLNPQLQFFSELLPSFNHIHTLSLVKNQLPKSEVINKDLSSFQTLEVNEPTFFWNSNHLQFPKFNFRIKKGDFLLIIGPSGLGKTTFAHLLAGLTKPKSGNFTLNNKSTLSTRDLNSLVAYMPQEVHLLEENVKNNLTLLNNIHQNEEIYEVLKLVGLNRRIQNLEETPQALSLKLSGGEKQRLILAQTLLLHRPILLLDEATNSLDEGLENDIITNIKNKWPDLIIIAISHKSSLMKFANQVVNLDDSESHVRKPRKCST